MKIPRVKCRLVSSWRLESRSATRSSRTKVDQMRIEKEKRGGGREEGGRVSFPRNSRSAKLGKLASSLPTAFQFQRRYKRLLCRVLCPIYPTNCRFVQRKKSSLRIWKGEEGDDCLEFGDLMKSPIIGVYIQEIELMGERDKLKMLLNL